MHKETNNPTTAQTTVTAAGATAIKGVSNASSGKHAGVLGQSVPGDGRGVVGLGPVGVLGQTGSPTGFGTWGLATGAAAIGVLGRNLATSG